MIAASCPSKKKTTKEGKEEIEEATASSAAVVVCSSELDGIFLSGIPHFSPIFRVWHTHTHSSLCSCGYVAVSSDRQNC